MLGNNVLYPGFWAHGIPVAVIQKYGLRGGFVEMERERCIIRAGVCILGIALAMRISKLCATLFRLCLGYWPCCGLTS